MRLVFIRHAETHNSKDRLYQAKDSNIVSVTGEVVSKLRQKIADMKVNSLWSSQLMRSIQTAELFGVPIQKTGLLDEFREPSNLFDQPISVSSSYIFDVFRNFDNNPFYTRENGESLSDFIDRILAFREHVESGSETLIVCVGHGFYIRLFALLAFVERDKINSRMLKAAFSMKLNKLYCASFNFTDQRWSFETWNSEIQTL